MAESITHLSLDKSSFDKDELIRTLSRKNRELTIALEHEIAVNDKQVDINIELKQTILNLKTQSNVSAHPSTIKTLTAAVRTSESRLEQLREALIVAISMIPFTRENQYQIERLKTLSRSY